MPLRERRAAVKRARAAVVRAVREKGRARLRAFRQESKRRRANLNEAIRKAREKLRAANKLAVQKANERELAKLATITRELAEWGEVIDELRSLASRTKDASKIPGGRRRAELLGEWWERVEQSADNDQAAACVVRQMRRPGSKKLPARFKQTIGRQEPEEWLAELMHSDSSLYADCLAQVDADNQDEWDREEREYWEAQQAVPF